MDKSTLPQELQRLANQFAKFRKEYLTLKTHHAAQEELIELQKLELEKMNSRVEQLASALIDYQKRFNSALDRLESENRRLLNVIEVTNKCEKSRDEDDFFMDVQRRNDNYIHRLEDDLEDLKSKLASQEEKNQQRIKSLEQRHSNEIAIYEEKIKQKMLQEKRFRDEIDAYKKNLEDFDSTDIPCRLGPKKNADSTAEKKYSHPALQDPGDIRKKKSAADCRWPQLEISVKKEPTQKSIKRKKLFSNDETVVDLTT